MAVSRPWILIQGGLFTWVDEVSQGRKHQPQNTAQCGCLQFACFCLSCLWSHLLTRPQLSYLPRQVSQLEWPDRVLIHVPYHILDSREVPNEGPLARYHGLGGACSNHEASQQLISALGSTVPLTNTNCKESQFLQQKLPSCKRIP